MLGIYVTKSWLESIGNAAELIVKQDVKGSDRILILADEKKFSISYPFVEADVMRKPAAQNEKNELVIHMKIPSHEITAVIDFTETDRKKVGF